MSKVFRKDEDSGESQHSLLSGRSFFVGSSTSFRNDSERKLKTIAEGIVLVDKPALRWSDIIGLDAVKEDLKESLKLVTESPHISTDRVTQWNRILLFGPNGNGKTMLAKALASESEDTTYISVSSSEITTKSFEEPEKLVQNLFHLTREQRPSILFLDEVDYLNPTDPKDQSGSTKRIRKEFMKQMLSFHSDNDGILLLAATNVPWTLDGNIINWFVNKLYIPLPGERARIDMFELYLGDTSHSLTDDDLKRLGKEMTYVSGEEISSSVRDVLKKSTEAVHAATHFRRVVASPRTYPRHVVDDLWAPCPSDFPGAVELNWADLPADKLYWPPISLSDLMYNLIAIGESGSHSNGAMWEARGSHHVTIPRTGTNPALVV
ncbi:unnamed protein product [Timema podura]|uniref:AAA+ ATPase domain-containing protein n=1 Tax=Timema podura TaxID=61482 RepID=A0ABN7PIG8_TIMPD|nr:unnamed protein product [Timema podura]